MNQPTSTIGNWTESDLAKYIREAIERLLPTHIPGLTVDDLVVAGTFTLSGKATINHGLVTVGASGAPPFTNGWTNFGGNYQAAGYWKDNEGVVHLEGLIKSGTLGIAAFVLPPGFTPSASRVFTTYNNGAVGFVQVLKDGSVQPMSGTSTSYSLEGITFRTGTS